MNKLFARIPRPARQPAASFGPDSVEVRPRALRVGEDWCRTFTVTGYPREVRRGWLEPLCAHPGRLDVALHIDPVPQDVAAERLRRQLARLESARRADAAKGRLADPEVEVAADDARDLAAGLARGEEKLFRVGLCLTVHARDEKALESECARVKALLSSMLLDAKPATWRSLQGWASTLPLGVDALGGSRAFDTDALAASFPSPSFKRGGTATRCANRSLVPCGSAMARSARSGSTSTSFGSAHIRRSPSTPTCQPRRRIEESSPPPSS